MTTIRVSQGSRPSSSVVVKKATDLTVQGLKNVVSTDIQDGYTLVYDSDTNKWYTQNVGSVVSLEALNNVVSDDLQDGYTIVYDSTTNKWITQAPTANVQLDLVDGGTY